MGFSSIPFLSILSSFPLRFFSLPSPLLTFPFSHIPLEVGPQPKSILALKSDIWWQQFYWVSWESTS